MLQCSRIFYDWGSLIHTLSSSLRTIRNKAITDAITAGYETRLELQSIREEAETAFQDKKKEVLENIDTARKDFLDTLGRYL